jgi:hypothetical protein
MKWFFYPIKSFVLLGIVPPLLWALGSFVRVCSAIVRGRSVRLPCDIEVVDVPTLRAAIPQPILEPEPSHVEPAPEVSAAATEPAADKSWLADIRRLTLLSIDSVYRLDVLLRNPLTKNPFRDLFVLIFPEGEHLGIEYVVREKGGVEFFAPLSCQLSLEPANDWHRHRAMKNGDFVSDAKRIEIEFHGEKHEEKQAFARSDGFFFPVATKAA